MPKKSELIPRLITSGIGIPALAALIMLAPHWGFFLFVLFISAICIWEFCSITFSDEHPPGRIFAIVIGLATITLVYFDPYLTPDMLLPSLAGAVLAIFLFYLFFFRDQSRVTHHIGSSITAIIYGGLLLLFLPMMTRDLQGGGMWVLMAIALVWSSDSGAYFTGNFFGKRKLYKSVSPNKSVEGSAGGLVATILFAFAFDALFTVLSPDNWTSLSPLQVLALAIPANILGQCGDLVESLIKRAHDVKDSGTIIYGHGGILDRIDALFFAAPWVYYFAFYGV